MFNLDRWQKNWLILLAYAALAVGLTHPMFWNITRGAYGQEGHDVLHYVWQLWWVKYALLTLHQLPSNVTALGWPYGIYHPLLFVTPYIDLLGLPITLLSRSFTTYNVHVLTSFTLSGFTAYLLTYNITGQRWAGFIGGIIFAFTAHRWAHAFTGHLYQITIYWGPIFAWAMWRFVRQPNKKWGLWAGFSAGIVALTHVMHAAYWLLPVALVLLIWGWRSCAPATPNWWRGVVTGGLWGSLPLALLAGPFYGYFFATLGQTEGDLEASGIVANATDLLAFLTPAPDNPFWRSVLPQLGQLLPPVDLDESVAYIGLAALALAAVGFFGARRRETTPWLWLALLTALLSMGPFLKIGGQVVSFTVGDTRSYIPLPYAVLANIPPLSWGRTTGRLNETLMLAVAVLSAYGAAYLLNRFGFRLWVKAGLLLLAAFFVAESMVVFPFTRATPQISPWYWQAQAAAANAAGGVLDLPLRNKEEVNRAMFGQTFHTRPIIGGYIHRRFQQVEYGQHLADLLFRPAAPVPAFRPPTDDERLAALSTLKISTVILQKDMVDRDIDAMQVEFVEHLLGRPAYEDEYIRVFQVPPHPPLTEPLLLARASNWTPDGLFPESNSPRHAYILVPHSTTVVWSLAVEPMTGPTVLTVDVSNLATQRMLVVQPQHIESLPVAVEPRIYRVNLVNDELCRGQSGCFPLRFDHVALHEIGPATPAPVVWGNDNIRLVNASVDTATGQPVVTLTWQPHRPLDFEPTVFVHIFDADGNKIGQIDRRILDGLYPPSVWKPDVLVSDNVPLPVPAGIDWQNYTLKVGLYNAATNERIPITSSPTEDNSIRLPFNQKVQ